MSRLRAADDFATIRARIEEMRRERERLMAPADDAAPARDSAAERRRRERIDGSPPPWVPTIFVR